MPQNFGTSYYRLYGYVRVRELEMDGTAISLGKGRRMQIAYVEYTEERTSVSGKYYQTECKDCTVYPQPVRWPRMVRLGHP